MKTHYTVQKFGDGKIFKKSLFCSPKLLLFDQKYSAVVKDY